MVARRVRRPPTASETAPDRAAGPSSSAPAQSAGVGVTLEYTGGQVSGDTARVEVPLGEPVTLVVTSDVADEVHVHGYDRSVAVAGDPARLRFRADIPGVFEVELEQRGVLLTQLEVR